MNKSQLIDAMAAGAGISKAAAKKALNYGLIDRMVPVSFLDREAELFANTLLDNNTLKCANQGGLQLYYDWTNGVDYLIPCDEDLGG